MPPERKRVWNLGRQIIGNLLPVLISLPFLGLSLQEIALKGPTSLSFIFATIFLLVGWIAVNFLGLIGNSSLKKSLEIHYKNQYEYDISEKFFVGFSRPGRHGLLDPHEDIGFLVFRENEIEFLGEVHNIHIDWNQVKEVGLRPNIHSWLGLGGWVSIDAAVGEKQARLLIEPRVKATHWGNARLRKKFVGLIQQRISNPTSVPA